MEESQPTDTEPQPESTEQGWVILRWRYWRLIAFFGRSLFSLWLLDYFIPRILGIKWVQAFSSRRHRNMAIRFRKLAIKMGGVMIKLGQFLSSRVDLMPPAVIEELSGLQDKVEPVDYDSIKKQFEKSVNCSPEEMFSYFEEEPIASASLGQVHLAGEPLEGKSKHSGQETAVKIQRPNIRRIIEIDLAAVQWAVGWLKYIGFIRRRANLDALYDEFASNLRQELDYRKEADNANRFSALASRVDGIDIPTPHWNLSTDQVLVLDRVEGIKITDYEKLEAVGISRHAVAKRLQRFYLHQIYEEGIFHADPHPGNIFVRPDKSAPEVEDGKPFKLVFVDFGMIGEIPEETREKLKDVLVASIQRDYRRLVRLAKDLNFLLPEADERAVSRAIETLFDRYYGVTLGELSQVDLDEIEDLISEFRDILFEFPFQVPQDFIMLGRCLGILNGITTGLDPDFRPVEQLEEYAREIAGDEFGPEFEDLSQEALQWFGEITRIPRQLNSALQQFQHEPLQFSLDPEEEELTERLDSISTSVNRLSDTLIIIASTTGGFLLVDDQIMVAYTLWSLSGLFVLRSWWYRL